MLDQIDIRTVRTERLEISQAALAKELGVDQSTISDWELNGPPKNLLVREAVTRRIEALLEQKERAA